MGISHKINFDGGGKDVSDVLYVEARNWGLEAPSQVEASSQLLQENDALASMGPVR